MVDLSKYTDLAATTIQTKIVTDTERMIAVTAWRAVDNLDDQTREEFYGELAER